MSVYQRDNLSKCIEGFEHINRYHDVKKDINTAKILPGEFYVSARGEMISTVLGSCISACIRDPVAGIGGMNHFMLPIDRRAKLRGNSYDPGMVSRYGDFAMEMLINSILRAGGKRKNLEVKVFGGGKVISHMSTIDVGMKNIEFVHQYLEFEGLKVVAEDVGNIYPRKVNYFTDTGRVMMKKIITANNNTISNREDSYYSNILAKPESSAELEMFK
ncbi:MAG: chemotaxis protein CheD [Gammaproteobacteria bacterium]|nr:MAG: chemotaxis protein CheD [Gammaproteobacteria bacterium]